MVSVPVVLGFCDGRREVKKRESDTVLCFEEKKVSVEVAVCEL